MSNLIEEMATARERFLALVADVRPELHRYCARMTGSVFDGEDVVQETLAKAHYALSQMEAPPPLRPWLFRIAHNAAMDHLRRYEHKNVSPTDEVESLLEARDGNVAPDDTRVELALERFAELPPLQRSAIALKDVLELTLEETADTMGITVGAVKAALARARASLSSAARPPIPANQDLARLRHYARLFNARDWDGLRALFGEETRLELVSRHERKGRAAAQYLERYEAVVAHEAIRAVAGTVRGIPAIGIFRDADSPHPAYFVLLAWKGASLASIRDYRHVAYIARDAVFEPAPSDEGRERDV